MDHCNFVGPAGVRAASSVERVSILFRLRSRTTYSLPSHRIKEPIRLWAIVSLAEICDIAIKHQVIVVWCDGRCTVFTTWHGHVEVPGNIR